MEIIKMKYLVKCTHCNRIYDLMGEIKEIARYADCTVFESPCCHRTVDDRTWKSLPDFEKVERSKRYKFPFDNPSL